MSSTLGFLREYLRPDPARIEVSELTCHRDGELLPATLYRRAGRVERGPAWVLLHGLTYHGRAHPSLDRFARAITASGVTTIVPDFPEWSALQVDPSVTGPGISGAIDALIEGGHAEEDRIGVLGFSFGATQSLGALGEAELSGRVRAVVAWGGYYDLHRLFRFGLTGHHELDGIEARADSDPYGTWIMGANFLQSIPEHAHYNELAGALHELAVASGRVGVTAGNAIYDPLKVRLRQGLPLPQRELFDLLAPPAAEWPNSSPMAIEFANALADAALEREPLLDPGPLLSGLRTRTLIAHGRDDQLIPYTESIRLRRALPAGCPADCAITSLFAHSTGATGGRGPITQVKEMARFYNLLRRLLHLI